MAEMKDVEIPQAMQGAMAREAEAVREKRARLIKAEVEQEASSKPSGGAQIAENPIALELRRMQTIAEVRRAKRDHDHSHAFGLYQSRARTVVDVARETRSSAISRSAARYSRS